MTPNPTSQAPGPTRRTPRALLIAAALLMIVRIASYNIEQHQPIPMRNAMTWHEAASAEAEAARTNRLVLYEFSAHWCPPCKKLQREVFADARRAADIEKRFVAVQVMVTKDTASDAVLGPLLERHAVQAYPTVIALAPGGEYRRIQGYGNRDRFMELLRRAELELRR